MELTKQHFSEKHLCPPSLNHAKEIILFFKAQKCPLKKKENAILSCSFCKWQCISYSFSLLDHNANDRKIAQSRLIITTSCHRHRSKVLGWMSKSYTPQWAMQKLHRLRIIDQLIYIFLLKKVVKHSHTIPYGIGNINILPYIVICGQ